MVRKGTQDATEDRVQREPSPTDIISSGSFTDGGLFLCGKILARTRKEFKQENGDIRICRSYKVLAGCDLHWVDDWSFSPTMPIGQQIEVEVSPRAFASRSGAQYRLNIVEKQEGFREENQDADPC